jgi:hypothetical protein
LLRWSAHRFMLTGLLMLLTGHWTAQLSLLLLTSQLGHLIAASKAVCRWEHSEQGSFVVCQHIWEFHNACLPYITMPAIYHVGWELPSTRFQIQVKPAQSFDMHCFAVWQSKFAIKLGMRATFSLTLLRRLLSARIYEELLLNSVMSRKIFTSYHKIRYVQSLNWVALPCAFRQPKWFQVWLGT